MRFCVGSGSGPPRLRYQHHKPLDSEGGRFVTRTANLLSQLPAYDASGRSFCHLGGWSISGRRERPERRRNRESSGGLANAQEKAHAELEIKINKNQDKLKEEVGIETEANSNT